MTAQGRGRLVAFEGVDGCGKSTQARRLAVTLGALLTHEPGGTGLGGGLRRLLLDADHAGAPPLARSEALLMAADRAQHVGEIVRPALDAGRWVVTDRFSGSTLAYQGYGRGLALEPLGKVIDWATEGLEADVSVLLDVPLDLARRRLGATPDRLERLDGEFYERVRAGYLALAAANPARWVVIDGVPPEGDVAAAVGAAVAAMVGTPGATVEPASR